MLIPVIEKNEIHKLNQQLVRILAKSADFKGRKYIQYPQGGQHQTIQYSSSLGLWWYIGKSEWHNDRYWNCFGFTNPNSNGTLHITVEINMAVQDINSRLSGLWAKDEFGKVFLLHNGRIGGGAKGVGKTAFENYFVGKYEDIPINEDVKKYASVLRLDDANAINQLKLFVNEIKTIKESIKQNRDSENNPHNPNQFNKEFAGIKSYGLPEKISATCNHGLVVNELANQFKLLDLKFANDQKKDLFLVKNNSISHLFEIKTAISLQHIYTAIGQLLLHSLNSKNSPKLFFVCPEEIPDKLIIDLKRFKIITLTFTWKNGKPIFKNLIKLLNA